MSSKQMEGTSKIGTLSASLMVEFGGGFCRPTTISMTPVQMQNYLDQGEEYALGLIGVSLPEFESWHSTDGTALCMERLRSGKLCGNQVGLQLSLEKWKLLHRNECCHLHK